ncbi:MAG TPA: VWA domain-containing protein [Spirochaetes bacterium]|nr:VWA domain-containing protein [Spirochaetota bacterium]
MKRLITITVILFTISVPVMVWAAASKEGASSSARGKYLAGQGIIVPPQEVYIDSYIAHINYHYPRLENEVGITLYSGHRQVSSGGQEEIIQIGIQGRELGFEELPPMNLAFVIDRSGSMSGWKMEWVKESFYIFIEKVREQDFVALVVFDDSAQVVLPSTQMNTAANREKFKKAVRRITIGGGTNLVSGLTLGYKEVSSNYNGKYVNRVLFLTDGMGTSTGILDMAQRQRNRGINVSTIGVGTGFDLRLMRDLAENGGGSSRFISDREEMEKTFGSELDRMVVPVANDLYMKLEFLQDVEITGTWGYDGRIKGNTIHYYLSTLHHRDYETILVQVRIPASEITGEVEFARFSLNYSDLRGKKKSLGPYYLSVNFVDTQTPVAGFSDGMVLQSGTMLHFAQALKGIGEVYYSSQIVMDEINQMTNALWEERKDEQDIAYEKITSPAIQELEQSIHPNIKKAIDMTVAMKKEVLNARKRLDNEGFDEQIEILDNYIKIFGKELKMDEQELAEYAMAEEITPPVEERPLEDHIENLFREMTLGLEVKKQGVIAVSGFTAGEEKSSELLSFLNETAILEFSKLDNMKLLDKQAMDAALEEQKLSFTDLMDTSNAISIGEILSANYIVTGSVIEMPGSVLIFGRIINVKTEEIESAAQVIVPKNSEMEALL